MDGSREAGNQRMREAQWLAGYEAAIDDAMQIINGMRGPAFANFSSPVLMHLEARLAELRRSRRQGAA